VKHYAIANRYNNQIEEDKIHTIETAAYGTTVTRNPLKRLYNWVLGWSKTPYGVPALFTLAFMESSVFPVPPDVLLIALCLGSHKKWAWYAFLCTLGSVIGGLFGYTIGYFLSNSLGEILIQWVGLLTVHGQLATSASYFDLAQKLATLPTMDAALGTMSERLQVIGQLLAADPGYSLTAAEKAAWCRAEAMFWFKGPYGGWAVAIAGFTPIPYKLFTITAGVFDMSLPVFTIASTLGRATRFFGVGAIIGLTYRYFGNSIQAWIDKYFNWLAIAFTILLIGGFYVLKFIK